MPKKNKKKIHSFLISALSLVFFMLWGSLALAQGKFDQQVSKPLMMMVAFGALSLLPIAIIMMTSFIKISVVLSLLRNALGTQQIPPNQVITGLSLILTVYIMSPIFLDVYKSAESVIQQNSNEGFLSQATLALAQEAIQKGQAPFRKFLTDYSFPDERGMFYKLAVKMQKTDEMRQKIKDDDFLILIPAFVISELTRAFKIGFIIFLPFLVVDMVVANILLSLGMFQLSPVTVSLPFKLLLFVIVDGWLLLAKGLVIGYTIH